MNATILLTLALAAPPPDLAMVPRDAIAVIHILGKDLWRSDLLSGLRTTLEHAGPKAVAAFDGGFYPPPSTLDRFTFVVLGKADGPDGPVMAGILAFDRPFDVAKVRATYCEGESRAVTGKPIYPLKEGGASLHFPDDKHVVIAPERMLEQFLTHKPGKPNSAVVDALERAAGGTTLVAAVDLKIVPPDFRRVPDAPEGIEPLLAADAVLFTVDTAAGSTKISFAAQYKTEGAAADADKSAKMILAKAVSELTKVKPEMEAVLFGSAEKPVRAPRPLADLPGAAAALMGLGSLHQFEAFCKTPPYARAGDKLVAEFTMPKEMVAISGYYAIGIGLMLPAVQKVREAAGRMSGQNNLKQIGIALHNYHDVMGNFPTQAPIHGEKAPKDATKRLSWRVHILPYLEQENLYRQFKLDEPWDSEHNKKLISKMPKTFADPRHDAGEGKTFYKGIAGPEAIFMKAQGRRIAGITDGTSNTIMVVAAGDAVTWTAPDDVEFDAKKPLPDLSKPFGPLTNVIFADGRVTMVDFSKLKPETIKALFTCTGGEIVDLDNLTPPKLFGGSQPARGPDERPRPPERK